MKILALSLLTVALPVLSQAAEPARPWSRPISVGTNSLVRSLAFTPNNQDLVVGCDKGVVKVFPDDCPDRLPRLVLEADSYETGLAISGDSKRLLVSGCPGGVSLFDLGTGTKLKTFHQLLSARYGLSPDGTRFWAEDSIHDLTTTNEPPKVRQFAGSTVLRVDDKQIITTKAGKISFWSRTDDKLKAEFDTGSPKFALHSLANDWLVISDAQGVHVWNLVCGAKSGTVQIKEGCQYALVSPDGKHLVTTTSLHKTAKSGQPNYALQVWDLASGKELKTVGISEYYWPIAISPKGQLAYTLDGHEIEFLDLGALR